MRIRRVRTARRFMKAACVLGLLCQVGPCTAETISQNISALAGQAADLFVREGANLLADSVFFFLDNLLVRWFA